MKGILSVFSMMLLIFTVSSLSAEKKEEHKAAAAFQKGIDAYEAGKMEAAVQEFRRADALNPSWRIQYNIGQCEAALRRYGLAIEAFELYLGQGGDAVPQKRQDEVLRELDRMRRMVGTIIIKGEPGVDVYVDIVKYGNTSVRSSIQVTAGTAHEISFVKDGKKLGEVKLTVSGGEVVELPVGSSRASTVSVKPVPSSQDVTSSSRSYTTLSVPAYSNMRQLKTAYREGRVTKEEYRRHQTEIRKRRQIEYDRIRADYRAGKITKLEYKEKISACKRKYEGK